jgi:hypothetical protein
MKSSRLLLVLIATIAGALDAQVTPGQSLDPATPGGVTVSGTVISEGTGNPIPFSTLRIQPIGRERFADRNGSFVYYSVPPGTYEIQARMLGYLPFDSLVQVVSNAPLVLTITLRRVPTSLEEVKITAPPRRCIFPDEMGFVSDPELALVLNEARKNAQREQLLRRTYPFEYQMAQSHATRDLVTGRSTLQYDTATYRSDDTWRYRRGRVVTQDRSKLFGEVRVMRLPTLADLADRHFLASHCFKYSGVVEDNGRPAHRIDFHTDSSLIAPDVEGSLYLDSATYLIKRAQFRLTRGGTVKPAILGLEVTTTYREILPNVALFDQILSVQPLPPPAQGGNPVEFREVQRLMSFRFLYGGPLGTSGHKWIPADSVLTGILSPQLEE